MKKRFLSLCMAVAMLLSCLCITPAAAADNGLRVQSVAPSEELIRQTAQSGQQMAAAQEDPDEIVDILPFYGDIVYICGAVFIDGHLDRRDLSGDIRRDDILRIHVNRNTRSAGFRCSGGAAARDLSIGDGVARAAAPLGASDRRSRKEHCGDKCRDYDPA